MSELSDSGLPLVQRVVTGHDADGRAVFKSEDLSPTKMIASGDASFLTIWSTETVPADNNDERDGRNLPTGLTLERGSVIRITDMLPGKQSPMHRTNSVDYGIVLEGEIELELEDGAKRTINTGGIIVQRGTNHSWRNPSAEETARVAFVLLDAKAATVDGVPLPDIHPGRVPA